MAGPLSKVVAVLVSLVIVGATVPVLLLYDAKGSTHSIEKLEGNPERGAYLARVAGCVGCHTDTSSGGTFTGGGPRIETVYGTFYAPNISSDLNFGIGAWTADQFAVAVRQGRAPDGRNYYPVFPYVAYSSFSDRDVADLWAALRTTTPTQTRAPDHELRFPSVSGRLLRAWKRLASFRNRSARDPSRGKSWNRGAKIVTGWGLCTTCHGPGPVVGEIVTGSLLSGAGEGRAEPAARPLIGETLQRRGWTAKSLADALRTGKGVDGEPFPSPMAEIVRSSTMHLADDDMSAIVEYLMAPR